MTYAQKFSKYCILADGTIYKWFKDFDKAVAEWESRFAKPGCAEEWLDEYDDVELVNMKSGEVLRRL